jgi:hypothetical protein
MIALHANYKGIFCPLQATSLHHTTVIDKPRSKRLIARLPRTNTLNSHTAASNRYNFERDYGGAFLQKIFGKP